MKIESISYHRNGNRGEDFYTVMFIDITLMNENQSCGELFIATVCENLIITDSDRTFEILPEKCRVTNLRNPHAQWDGEFIVSKYLKPLLEKKLKKINKESLYDLITIQ